MECICKNCGGKSCQTDEYGNCELCGLPKKIKNVNKRRSTKWNEYN